MIKQNKIAHVIPLALLPKKTLFFNQFLFSFSFLFIFFLIKN